MTEHAAHHATVGDLLWPALNFAIFVAVLVRFLRRTYVAVPRGRESDHLDVDAAVTRLLAGR